jgi:Spy/CpxP family protein refolding chaperone
MRPLWLLLAVLLVIPATADAGPRRRDRGDQVAQRPGAPRGDRRERAKARIRAMRAMILTEELDLDEATAARLAPILTQYDDALAKLLADRVRLRDELRSAEQLGDDGQMRRLLDALVHNQDQRWDLERQRFAELRKALTPRQAARLVDVLPEIDRRILKGLRAQRPAP